MFQEFHKSDECVIRMKLQVTEWDQLACVYLPYPSVTNRKHNVNILVEFSFS